MTVSAQPNTSFPSSLSTPSPLRDLADKRGFLIGAAVDMAALDGDPRYRAALARECNLLVAENVQKPHALWRGPTTYDFTHTDRLAQFAHDHGQTLRGHTLLWHQSVPRWLQEHENDYSSEALRELLQAYVTAVVRRYRGVITVWDVINEAVEDGETPGLRPESFWYRKLGPDYIAPLFHWAQAADPSARLYYNDYEAEAIGPKSDAIYRLVQDLLARGVPIHGVGLQGHLENGWRLEETHRANVRRLAALGLEWQITEADVRMPLNGAPPTESALAAQADAYRDLLELCLTEPGCQGFVTWGVTDAYSWIPGFRPGWGASLLLDEDFRPKPAYFAIAEALGR